MTSKRSRTHTFLAIGVIGVGVLITGVAGLFVYMSNTATPLHPNVQDVPSTPASSPSPEWAAAAAQAHEIARTGLAEQNLPGLSVAVGVGNTLVWAEGFGWADLEARVPVAPDTRFRLGTGSVALTSAAVGLLLEQNRLSLDEKIQTYVREFPEKPWPVTLRQVMGHVAGVRNDGGDEGPLYGKACGRTVEGLEPFAERDLLFEPGTQFRFSSYGWILVGAAVEAAAQEPFEAFMRARIFEPLGMVDTKADSPTVPIPNRATPYFPRFAADPKYGPDISREIDLSCYAGAGAYLSTPSDLVRFGLAVNAGTLLRPETAQLLQSPQRLISGEETGYGLGWDIETVDLVGTPTRWVGHDGTVLGGRVASLITFPDHDIVVAVMSNTSYADTEALAVKIAEAFARSGKDPTDILTPSPGR